METVPALFCRATITSSRLIEGASTDAGDLGRVPELQ